MGPQGAVESTWFIVRFYHQIKTDFGNEFSEKKESYPPDEAGELIKRQMAKKSWFDKITSWWVERSLFRKISYIAGFSLISGALGTLAGSLLLLSAVAVVLSLSIHKLFSWHEENRREAANISAEESIALGKDLRASNVHFQNTIAKLQDPIAILNDQSDIMREQTKALDSERRSIKASNDTLSGIIENVTDINDSLCQRKQIVNEKLAAVSGHIEQYDQGLIQLATAVNARGADLSDFSTTVQGIKEAKNNLSTAVTRFSLFVSAPPIPQKQEPEDDDFLSKLMRQNAEDERLISEWTSSM